MDPEWSRNMVKRKRPLNFIEIKFGFSRNHRKESIPSVFSKLVMRPWKSERKGAPWERRFRIIFRFNVSNKKVKLDDIRGSYYIYIYYKYKYQRDDSITCYLSQGLWTRPLWTPLAINQLMAELPARYPQQFDTGWWPYHTHWVWGGGAGRVWGKRW